MRAIAAWVAKQFDDGLTLVGGAIGVLLVLAGCGALFASMSGALVLATLLGAIFLCLLCLLFIAAHYTDPSIRMSEQEKTERWEQSPDFLKRSLLVFVVGMAIGMGVGGAIGQFTSWAAAPCRSCSPPKAYGVSGRPCRVSRDIRYLKWMIPWNTSGCGNNSSGYFIPLQSVACYWRCCPYGDTVPNRTEAMLDGLSAEISALAARCSGQRQCDHCLQWDGHMCSAMLRTYEIRV